VTPEAAVVTGPSRGIGRATALLLAERGCQLFLLGRPSPGLERTLADCHDANPQANHRVVACDVASTRSVEQAAQKVLDEVTPRAVINNAGVVERAPLLDLSLESLERQLDTNLVGPVWLARALLKAMLLEGRGSIVNVASISAQLGTRGQIAYNASKWALVGFTKSLAEELSGTGLSTVAVLPGSVDTDMGRSGAFPPRMTARDVALTLVHYALDAPLAHNGGIVEMFGV
jgi:3-oxoacyl-[acyl-carrier protein] reductase